MLIATARCRAFRTFVWFTVVQLTLITWFNKSLSQGDIIDQYIGCYQDSNEHLNRVMGPSQLMAKYGHTLTLELCEKICYGMLATFFGVEHYYECYCADVGHDKIGQVNDSLCNTPCAANSNQTCGGDQLLSVYTVCPFGFYGSSQCSNKCGHCKETVSHGKQCKFNTGFCFDGCEDGWEGSECKKEIDECQQNNANCSDICHNMEGSFICDCRAGFTLNDDLRTCRDIDECSTVGRLCDQECSNTVGSFFCSCRAGFELSLDGKLCYDVDECAANNGNCSYSCFNTVGNYVCSRQFNDTFAREDYYRPTCYQGVVETDQRDTTMLIALCVSGVVNVILIIISINLMVICCRQRKSPPALPFAPEDSSVTPYVRYSTLRSNQVVSNNETVIRPQSTIEEYESLKRTQLSQHDSP